MRITGHTKLLGVFGDPVEHTLSPFLHNAVFESLAMDMVYLPLHVTKESLKGAVDSIRVFEMPGINVTIPHKNAVIAHLDEVDDQARAIGSVNTVVNKDGRLTGHTTDGEGYMASLAEDTGFEVEGKRVVILGAGGAARSILYSILKRKPDSVTVSNRTIKKAEELVREFGALFASAKLIATGLDVGKRLNDCDLLINTTSAGMLAKTEAAIDLFEVSNLNKDAVVSDIVYRPLDTPLIKKAAELGLKVHKGLGMLVHQGALSFELWTGTKAPRDTMMFAAIQSLEVS